MMMVPTNAHGARKEKYLCEACEQLQAIARFHQFRFMSEFKIEP